MRIGEVENAMLAFADGWGKRDRAPYRFRTLTTFPKNFDAYLQATVVQYPALWVVFAGAGKIERVARGRWRAHCSFVAVVAAENLRNEQARRHGGTAEEPGSYQLAGDVARLFGDQRFGLDINAFEPMSIEVVDATDIPKAREISMYAVSFATSLYFDSMPDLTGPNDFRLFHANWDPAPYGHVDADLETPGVQIPDDVHAAGTDNIHLHQDDPA
jgi:phage gp37-like protein